MTFQVNFNGRDIQVEAEWIEGRLWYHVDGVTGVHAPQVAQRGKKAGLAHNTITAPMPGKVTKILKSEGDLVQVGDVVAALEAMKMEYSLKAEVAGKLGAIKYQVGDQVSLGQVLAEINESKE